MSWCLQLDVSIWVATFLDSTTLSGSVSMDKVSSSIRKAAEQLPTKSYLSIAFSTTEGNRKSTAYYYFFFLLKINANYFTNFKFYVSSEVSRGPLSKALSSFIAVSLSNYPGVYFKHFFLFLRPGGLLVPTVVEGAVCDRSPTLSVGFSCFYAPGMKGVV